MNTYLLNICLFKHYVYFNKDEKHCFFLNFFRNLYILFLMIFMLMKSIEINGAMHEGGGQILRTSIGMSAFTGKPVKIFNIRAKRCNPGIMPQHYEAINAVAKISNAELSNYFIGSKEIEFIPKKLQAKKIDLSISSAGSIALVLQAIMFAVLNLEKGKVKINVNGGAVCGKWAAPLNYVKNVLIPVLARFGYSARINITKYGYYPKGGGKSIVEITPSKLRLINLLERGSLINIYGIAHASKELKDKRVAERMCKSASKILNEEISIKPSINVVYVDSMCKGCGIELFARFDNTILGSDGLGERKIRAEDVGKFAARKLIKQIRSNGCADEYLADQIIPYMAISAIKNAEKSQVSVAEITSHAETNIKIVEKFLPIKFKIDKKNKRVICAVKHE